MLQKKENKQINKDNFIPSRFLELWLCIKWKLYACFIVEEKTCTFHYTFRNKVIIQKINTTIHIKIFLRLLQQSHQRFESSAICFQSLIQSFIAFGWVVFWLDGKLKSTINCLVHIFKNWKGFAKYDATKCYQTMSNNIVYLNTIILQ